MKKVMFVAHVESQFFNFHLPYLKWLKDNGYEVIVCTRGSKDIPYCDKKIDIPFERNPFSFQNIKCFFMMKKLFDVEKVDLIHCHTPVGGVISRLANLFSKNRTNIFYTAHGFHFYKGASILRWILFYPIERLLAKVTDIIFVMNKEDYEEAIKFKLHNGGKVVMTNGVGIDLSKVDNLKIDIDSKKKEFGIDNKKVILNVGELIPRKNQKVLIDFMKNVYFDNYVLLICGDGKLTDEYKKYINENNLNDKVKLLGFRTDIFEIMKMSDYFVFPSIHEGLPVALMQAIACGLPCIVSKIRGNVDLIKNDNIGYFCNFRDVEEFKKLIEKSEKNKELIIYRREYINDFSLKNVMSTYINEYKKVL